MRVNDIADRVYLVNLDKRKDRMDTVSQRLANVGIEYERFPAIDGNAVINNTYMNAGQFGNYLSNVKVLERCLNDGVNTVAIFEDDVEFRPDFQERLDRLYPMIPSNWDMIYLGHNHVASEDIEIPNTGIVRVLRAYAIHAIIMNRRTIEIAYNDFIARPMQADVYYSQLQYHIKAYGFSEQLCSQAPDWSDIDQKFVDHRWIFGWQGQNT